MKAEVAHQLKQSQLGMICGALNYLQDRHNEDVKAVVYRAQELKIGGAPDVWSLIKTFGQLKFETPDFPCTAAHAWYAAYVAARMGLASLLAELPERAAPCS